MKTWMKRWSLLGVMALIASLTVASFAMAQNGEEEPPFDAVEVEHELSWSEGTNDEGETVIFYSLDPDVDCSDPDNLPEGCEEVVIEDLDGQEGLNHGEYVSAWAQAVPKGPGAGCLVAEVAMSDVGKDGDDPDDPADPDGNEGNGGCPEGLYNWLQSFAGQDGQPTWVQERLAEKFGDDGPGKPANVQTGKPDNVPPQAGSDG